MSLRKLLEKIFTRIRVFCYYSSWIRRHKIYQESNEIKTLLLEFHQGKLDGEVIEKIQSKKLNQIIKYANDHCPYYQRIFSQCGFDLEDLNNFQKIPILDKNIISKNKKDIVSDEINKMFYTSFNTGGSTGDPMTFYRSSDSGKIDDAHHMFLYRLMGYKTDDKISSIGGGNFFVSDKNKAKNIYWKDSGDSDFPFGSLFYSSLSLSNQTIKYYVDHLLEDRPDFIRGYASAISDLANYIINNNISIPWNLKGIYLVGEQVYDWQINKISTAFKTSVFSNYGHSEVSVWAYSIGDTTEYVCSPFYGFVEVLSQETNQPVEVGEIGEVVVTGFYNFAFPFIRYRTSDLAVYAGKKNGAVVFERLVGRTQDFVYDHNRKKTDLMAIFDIHPDFFKKIIRWQVVQDVLGKLLIRIVKGDGFSNEDENDIRKLFIDLCGINPDLEYVSSIPLTKRGKLPFLIQNIK